MVDGSLPHLWNGEGVRERADARMCVLAASRLLVTAGREKKNKKNKNKGGRFLKKDGPF